MSRKRVVITGGAGFVGANLARKLLKKYDVHLITREKSNLWRLTDILNNVTIHPIGLHNIDALEQFFLRIKPEYILHTATYGAYPSQQNTDELFEVNIKGVLNLLTALSDISYSRCIIFGSSSEYGKKEKPMRETDILDPNNMYAVTKATQTHLARYYAQVHQKPITIFRLFNVYGPYEEKGRLVRNVIEASLTGDTVALATGKEARDFIYVDDIANACEMAFTSTLSPGEIFNIGTGVQTSIYQLAKLVVKLTRSKSVIERGVYPGRPWDSFHWKAVTKKTDTILHWQSSTALAAGLTKTITWYKKNHE